MCLLIFFSSKKERTIVQHVRVIDYFLREPLAVIQIPAQGATLHSNLLFLGTPLLDGFS